MIPIQKEKNEIYSELDNSKEFTIKASEKAFKILSANLYENKIKAIIRELSCNAVDAQVEAGVTKPFDVKLPSRLDPSFYVRDYGTGISEDDIYGVYTVLFASTKENTNDQTGMLGLGSKTPFSYTDSFNVVSYQNGIEKFYTVYMSDAGTPTISKVFEQETIEENGLKVMFSVNGNDFRDFIYESEQVFKYFINIPPNIIGEKINVRNLQDELVKINDRIYVDTNSDKYSLGYYVIQGNIAYPIDNTETELDIPFKNTDIRFYNCDIYIKADIGDIEFTPSRERIEKTKRNFEILNRYLENASNDTLEYLEKLFEKEIDSQITACKVVCDMRIEFPIFSFDIFKEVILKKGFYYSDKYKIENIDQFNALNYELKGNTQGSKHNRVTYLKTKQNYSKIPTKVWDANTNSFEEIYLLESTDWEISLNHEKQIHIVLVDDKKAYKGKSSSYFKNVKGMQIFIKDLSNQALIDKFVESFGILATVTKTSEMDELQRTPRARSGRWFSKLNPESNNIGNQTYLDEILDNPDTDKFYVVYYQKHSFLHNDKELSNERNANFIELFGNLGIIDNESDIPFIVVHNRYRKSIEKKYPEQAINFFDYVIDEFVKKTPLEEWNALEKYYSENKSYCSVLEKIFDKVPDMPMALEYKKYHSMKSSESNFTDMKNIFGDSYYPYKYKDMYDESKITVANGYDEIYNYYEENFPLLLKLHLYYSDSIEKLIPNIQALINNTSKQG